MDQDLAQHSVMASSQWHSKKQSSWKHLLLLVRRWSTFLKIAAPITTPQSAVFSVVGTRRTHSVEDVVQRTQNAAQIALFAACKKSMSRDVRQPGKKRHLQGEGCRWCRCHHLQRSPYGSPVASGTPTCERWRVGYALYFLAGIFCFSSLRCSN